MFHTQKIPTKSDINKRQVFPRTHTHNMTLLSKLALNLRCFLRYMKPVRCSITLRTNMSYVQVQVGYELGGGGRGGGTLIFLIIYGGRRANFRFKAGVDHTV